MLLIRAKMRLVGAMYALLLPCLHTLERLHLAQPIVAPRGQRQMFRVPEAHFLVDISWLPVRGFLSLFLLNCVVLLQIGFSSFQPPF